MSKRDLVTVFQMVPMKIKLLIKVLITMLKKMANRWCSFKFHFNSNMLIKFKFKMLIQSLIKTKHSITHMYLKFKNCNR